MQETAKIKRTEIKWADPVEIQFGFSGLDENHALLIMRDLIRQRWPEQTRPKQCVYVIRLAGHFAVQYPKDFSPVIYIGEGSASDRLYNHAGNWLVDLVRNVPGVGVNVRIAEVARKNHPSLYQYVEADMLDIFQRAYGAIPWFNQQSEVSKQRRYKWKKDAWQDMVKHLGVGSGNTFRWAIQPTKNNIHYRAFTRGRLKGEAG